MSGKKILVVDDEPFFVDILTARLVAAGFEVCAARNGEEAISKSRSEKPLVILMDVMMPKVSGLEALKKIRQDPETKNIPAIIFSAKGGMKDFFTDISRVEFLAKPFDLSFLLERIEALLKNPAGGTARAKHAVLVGVEDIVTNKVRDLLARHNFQVLVVLSEEEAVALSRKSRPDMILSQFWEDEKILDPRKISEGLLSIPAISKIPLYVYCKEALSLEAMKHFKPERIIAYGEVSDLLKKLEALVK